MAPQNKILRNGSLQSCATGYSRSAANVAQSCTLPYRRFLIGSLTSYQYRLTGLAPPYLPKNFTTASVRECT